MSDSTDDVDWYDGPEDDEDSYYEIQRLEKKIEKLEKIIYSMNIKINRLEVKIKDLEK